MEKSEYIKNFLKEVPCDIDPTHTIFVTKDNELYVGSKGIADVQESMIDILANYEITQLDTQESWKASSKKISSGLRWI